MIRRTVGKAMVRVPIKESVRRGDRIRQAAARAVDASVERFDPEVELEDVRSELEVLREENLRLVADEQNYRRRIERLYEARLQDERSEFLGKILSVVDGLEQALRYARPGNGVSEGVRLTHEQLLGILRDEGVEPIDAVGQAFDPSLHEAVSVAYGHADDGIVVEEERRGYIQNGTLLRPSRVVVSATRRED
jgi:molecular chaperone GrpE